MCQVCNGKLNSRFEEPAKPVIRQLMAGARSLDPSATTTLALWLLKTWLLLAHPQAVDSEGGLEAHRWGPDPADEDLFGWAMTTSAPPTTLSLWLTRRDLRAPSVSEPRRVPLPTIIEEGRTIKFRSLQFGIDFANAGFLDISLVYHPGWEIRHPLETEGTALRLWPITEALPLDLTRLPATAPDEMTWLKGPRLRFGAGSYGGMSRDPLGVDTNFLRPLPGVISLNW